MTLFACDAALADRRHASCTTPGVPFTDDDRTEERTPFAHMFPPALVPVLRRRLPAGEPALAGIYDASLAELLTVVFFAGLDREEGALNPVRVVFVGGLDLPPAASNAEAAELARPRWSAIRFRKPRPFSAPQLVKLAAATAGEHMHVVVAYRHGMLAIIGLARESASGEGDPFLALVTARPGGLSIRSGRRQVLDYDHGRVRGAREDVLLSIGPVRRALEASALASGLSLLAVPAYLEVVRSLVGEMAAHGRGGILVFSVDAEPALPANSPYETELDGALTGILARLYAHERERANAPPVLTSQRQAASLHAFLQAALIDQLEATIEELGALTALDGATVVARSLALAGFGVVLPLEHDEHVVEAHEASAARTKPFDLRARGTRHRAAATHARRHPGSIVFVASTDGHLGCFFRAPSWPATAFWHFHPGA